MREDASGRRQRAVMATDADVVKHALLTPRNPARSMGYRADRHRTRAPINSDFGHRKLRFPLPVGAPYGSPTGCKPACLIGDRRPVDENLTPSKSGTIERQAHPCHAYPDDGRSSWAGAAAFSNLLKPRNDSTFPGHRNRHFLAADSTAVGAWFTAAHRSTGGLRCCHTMPAPRLESLPPGRRGTAMTADHHRQARRPL